MKMPYPLILASTSKYRSALLKQLGWEFTAVSPEVDEEEAKILGLAPEQLAIELSRQKALAVFKKFPEACVIGSDQVCSLEDKIFDKPGTSEAAIQQLLSMQGKVHSLLTAVTVIGPQETTTFLNTTKLHMRDLSLEEIENYVKADLPLDCAGSYKLEARGIKLFERIEMTDHTAIIGLPLIQLTSTLMNMGYPF